MLLIISLSANAKTAIVGQENNWYQLPYQGIFEAMYSYEGAGGYIDQISFQLYGNEEVNVDMDVDIYIWGTNPVTLLL